MHVTNAVLEIGVLGCKSAVAVLLVAAGGAKLADPAGFAGTVRLFLPPLAAGPLISALAVLIAAGEVAAGAASLALPRAWWLNLVVLAICVSFLVVWTVGYLRYRGRPCRCFGALSRRGFSIAGVFRAAGLVLAGLLGSLPVSAIAVRLGPAAEFALLAAALLVALAAFSAAAGARAGVKPRSLRRWALWCGYHLTWRSRSGPCSAGWAFSSSCCSGSLAS